MPLFEYECQECGCRMELIQRVGARPLKKVECDDCEVVRPVKKLLSAPAFQFKGDGWYVTDYADKKGKKDPASSDHESSGDSKSSSSDSSDKSEKSASKDAKSKGKAEGTSKGKSKSKGKSSGGSSKKGD